MQLIDSKGNKNCALKNILYLCQRNYIFFSTHVIIDSHQAQCVHLLYVFLRGCSVRNFTVLLKLLPILYEAENESESVSHSVMSDSVTLWTLAGSSVHRILQARILEWVAIPFSRGSS